MRGRPARRQPGPDRPHEPRPQAPHVRAARPHGLQGDRGRLPVREPDRLRLRPRDHRAGRHPGRRHDPGADPGPPRADRAHVRGLRGRAAGDRAPVQLDVDPAAPGRLPVRPRRASRKIATDGAEDVAALQREVPGHRLALRVLPRVATPAPSWSTPSRSATPCPRSGSRRPSRRWSSTCRRPSRWPRPNVYADSIEWMHRHLERRDGHRALAAPAQRPRHRRRRRRAGLPGRRGPDRGLPVRQRRAHRQRRPGDAGHEPVHPGHRPADRLLRHRRDPPHRRVLQPAARRRAPPVGRRPGLHRVLRQPPGRDQQGLRRDARDGRRGRATTSTTTRGRSRTCRSTRRTSAARTRP